MQIIRSVQKLKAVLQKHRDKREAIGFVPTMGYFHQGHLALMRQSVKHNDVTVVSIYVNPAQFGPKEDLARYPRDLSKDMRLARKENVDILFIPSDNDIYPDGYLTYIEVGQLSDVLCGKFRPGHFKGVATIVAKLLNMISPQCMYLGQKDAQQVVVISKMVRDLNIPVEIKVLDTVREADGLAMSSRNSYLSVQERQRSAGIYQALKRARVVLEDTRSIQMAVDFLKKQLRQSVKARIQYVACVNPETLIPATVAKGKLLIAVAVFVGKTRLIDNIQFTINAPIKK